MKGHNHNQNGVDIVPNVEVSIFLHFSKVEKKSIIKNSCNRRNVTKTKIKMEVKEDYMNDRND